MRSQILVIAALVALIASAFVFAHEASDNVIDLTTKNFEEKLGEKEFGLVAFYAPWCGHCKRLAPEYSKLAEKFINNEKIGIYRVNGDEESNLMTQFEIQGFPTVKLFKNGKLFRDYDGERDAESLTTWLNKKTGSVTVSVKTADELAALKESNKVLIVGYFTSKDSANIAKLVQAADDKELEDFIVADVSVPEILSKNGIEQDSVVIYRNFDSNPAVSTDFENIIEFVKSNAYPLVDEVSGSSFQRFVDKNLPIGILFIDFASEQKESLINLLTEVAEQFKGKVSFGYSDASIYGEQLNIMGGDKSVIPGFAIMDLEKRANYPLKGEATKEAIVQLTQSVVDGTAPKFFKTQEIPETNDEPVKVVVGKSYDDIVVNNDNDVLLEFYAPWCGHCKSLEPKYTQLAEELKDVSGLTIAKVDATENDTPINIEGFPTIYFFPKGKKDSPIVYEGDRTVEDLKTFLQKNAVGAKFENIKKDEL